MKKTKSLKRILAGALAALMSLSAIPVAFAADEPTFPAEGITVTAPEEIVLDGTSVSGNPTLTVSNPTDHTMTDVYLSVTGGTSVSVPATIEPGSYSYPITGSTSSGRQIIYALSYSLDNGENTYVTYGFSYTRSATTPVLAQLRHHPSVGNWNDIDLGLTIDKGVINQTSVEGQGGAEVVSYSDLYIDRSQGTTWDALGLEFSYTLRTNHADRKKYYDIWVDQDNVATFGFGDVAATGVSKTGIKDKYFGDTTRFAGEYDGYAEYNLVYGNVPSVETMQFYFWFKFNAVDWLFGDKDGAHTLGKTIVTVHTVDKGALRSAVQNVAQKNYQSFAYSSDSYTAFLDAYTKANEVLSKYQSTQAEIDSAKATLDVAVNSLRFADANYSVLDAAIAEAEQVLNDETSADKYTAESLQTLRNAYEAGLLLKNPVLDQSHQSEIDAAALAIEMAIGGLEGFADYSGVAQAISVYEKLNGRYFDADDLAAVTELVAAARDEMTNNRRPATEQSAVDAMAVEILNAISDLKMLPADYAALDTLVDTATEIYLSSDNVYTVDSIKALEAALLAAMDVQDADYTIDKQNLVDEAYNALDTAMKTMVKLPADTTTLEQFIEDAIEMTQVSDYETYYTADSRAALEAALAQAQTLLEQELTIDDEAAVAAAAKKLADAMVQMDVVLADYSELEAAIKARTQELEIARTAVTEDGDPLYKAASLARLESMIKAAGTIDHTLSIRDQQIVDDAVTMLNSYQLEKNAADTVALKALIAEKQDALNNASDEYTTESKEALQAAISAANAVIAANYDITMQWRVDEAYKTLEAVELVLKGADYAKVDAAIDAAEKFLADEENQAIYTQEALQMIQDALDAANGIDRGAYTIRDQEAVDAFATAIDNAIAAADGSYNPADKQALADAIDAAKAKLEAEDINDYTDASIEALKAAIADAEAYLEQDLDITDNDEIAAKAEALGAMELELKPADKSGVQDAIDKAEEIIDNSDQYTDEYIEKVNDALDNLYEILDEDLTIKDQDKVDNAIDAVDEIAENPSYVGANLDSLNAAIDAAEAKKAAPDYMNYTETSRQAFEAVLAEAIALRDSNPDITQQQAVEDMAARLNGMELSLEDADYSEMDAAVAEAEALLADLDALKDQYTLTSIEALQNAVTEAGLVERDQDVSYQSVIDAAAQAVRDAIAGLTTYNRIDGISIAGGDRRDDDVIYYKVSWMKTYKSQPVTLHLEGLEGVDVASIKWEAANWSVDDPEATITDNGDGTATITPNGKGIGARSMWVKVTVTDVNGNDATDIVKVRFHKWDWQAK